MKCIQLCPGQCTDGSGGCQPYAATSAVKMEQTRNEAKRRSAEADRSTELLHGILPEQLLVGKGVTERIAIVPPNMTR